MAQARFQVWHGPEPTNAHSYCMPRETVLFCLQSFTEAFPDSSAEEFAVTNRALFLIQSEDEGSTKTVRRMDYRTTVLGPAQLQFDEGAMLILQIDNEDVCIPIVPEAEFETQRFIKVLQTLSRVQQTNFEHWEQYSNALLSEQIAAERTGRLTTEERKRFTKRMQDLYGRFKPGNYQTVIETAFQHAKGLLGSISTSSSSSTVSSIGMSSVSLSSLSGAAHGQVRPQQQGPYVIL